MDRAFMLGEKRKSDKCTLTTSNKTEEQKENFSIGNYNQQQPQQQQQQCDTPKQTSSQQALENRFTTEYMTRHPIAPRVFQADDEGGTFIIKGDMLARGGFAEVFKGTRFSPNANDKGEIVAIKKFGLKNGSQKTTKKKQQQFEILAREQILFEKRALKMLSDAPHKHIIKLIAEGPQFLALEFAPGNLFDLIANKGPLDNLQLSLVMQQLCSAVDHLHHLQLCHLDIKPENILLDSQGHVLLADFGCARHVPNEKIIKGKFGTTTYQAPEVSEIEFYNPLPCDIWSLACVYFTCFNGTPPFNNTGSCPYYRFVLNYQWDRFWESHAHFSKGTVSEVIQYRFMEILGPQPHLRPSIEYLVSEVFIDTTHEQTKQPS